MKINKAPAHAIYAWVVVFINLGVILWGAYVRATGSGAGCGSHWPLCNGVIIPRPERIETLIEFIHRISSGVALISVVGLLIWSFKRYPRKHPVRIAAGLGMFFMILEALIGASLVLLELVGENDSVARAITGSIHLGNTFLLLASLSLAAWWSSFDQEVSIKPVTTRLWTLSVGLLGTMLLGMSGAITALGDTLYPSNSLVEGIQQDFSSTAHFLIRLRILHPIIALVVSGYLILIVGFLRTGKRDFIQKQLGRMLSTVIALQVLIGFVNVYLLAPIWMQLVHLFLADVVWILLVLFSAYTLAMEIAQANGLSQKHQGIIEEGA